MHIWENNKKIHDLIKNKKMRKKADGIQVQQNKNGVVFYISNSEDCHLDTKCGQSAFFKGNATLTECKKERGC